jgi:hypothetical protein
MSKTTDSALPKIYTVLPDEIRNLHPHGQWVFDRPGLVLNFACDVENDHFPVVEPWVEKLAAFIASEAPYMEFESPHAPGICYLFRHAAEHIILTQPAWSAKVMTRMRKDGPMIVDHNTGLPVISKLRN